MIAYYAHSEGSGHANYANLFAKARPQTSVVLTSVPFDFDKNIQVVQIPNEDTLPQEYEPSLSNLPRYAHYLPKSLTKITERAIQILQTLRTYAVKIVWVDVSVETASLVRLAGVPYAYCRMFGNRLDTPHQIAYDAAEYLFAYYPAYLESSTFAKQHREKTNYFGFLSRYAYTKAHSIIEKDPRLEGKKVLVLTGKGGTKIETKLLNKIAKALPKCKITAVGQLEHSIRLAGNVTALGYQKDIASYVRSHEVVIASCGMNLSSELLALKNKFVAVAEKRPYNEQVEFRQALVQNNLAVAFDEGNIKQCIADYLQLKPSPKLASSFVDFSCIFDNQLKVEYDS